MSAVSSGITLDDFHLTCELDECELEVVVVYEFAVALEDDEIWCWSGDGETTLRWEEVPERTDAGDVGDRRWRIGVRGDLSFSRSDEFCGSGEVCRDPEGGVIGVVENDVGNTGGARRGMVGRG